MGSAIEMHNLTVMNIKQVKIKVKKKKKSKYSVVPRGKLPLFNVKLLMNLMVF